MNRRDTLGQMMGAAVLPALMGTAAAANKRPSDLDLVSAAGQLDAFFENLR